MPGRPSDGVLNCAGPGADHPSVLMPPAPAVAPDHVPDGTRAGPPVVALDGVVRAFGTQTALDGLTFTVPARSITVLLGPNGAGKTTCTRIVTGALAPDAGAVRVFGLDPAVDGPEVRRRIGIVSAKPALYDRLSGLDNLRYAAELYGLGRGDHAAGRIAEAADRFGIAARGRGGETFGTSRDGNAIVGSASEGSGAGAAVTGSSCNAVITGAAYATPKLRRLRPVIQTRTDRSRRAVRLTTSLPTAFEIAVPPPRCLTFKRPPQTALPILTAPGRESMGRSAHRRDRYKRGL